MFDFCIVYNSPSGSGGWPVELVTWILDKTKPAVSMNGAKNAK